MTTTPDRTPDRTRTPVLTFRTPEDVLAAVPVLLGFEPSDSVVMMTFGGRETFHARIDMPAAADSSTRRSTCCSSRPWPTGWSRCSSSSTRPGERLAERLLDAARRGVRRGRHPRRRRAARRRGPVVPARLPGSALRRARPTRSGSGRCSTGTWSPRSREELAARLAPIAGVAVAAAEAARARVPAYDADRGGRQRLAGAGAGALRGRRPRRGAAGDARRRPCGTPRGAR